MLLALVALL